MVMVNDNRPCVKAVGALVRPGLHPSAKGEEERVWVCDGEASDLHQNREEQFMCRGSAHPPLEDDHDKLTFLHQQAGF